MRTRTYVTGRFVHGRALYEDLRGPRPPSMDRVRFPVIASCRTDSHRLGLGDLIRGGGKIDDEKRSQRVTPMTLTSGDSPLPDMRDAVPVVANDLLYR